ncbi:MAG TPA: GTP cyclohydrolase [Opitutaceae bacterium]|nr:GTP cyclohydrolase [Opitutaceae bacterium]
MQKVSSQTTPMATGTDGAPTTGARTAAPDLDALVGALQHAGGAVTALTSVEERPLYGTTLYLANCNLETRFGRFRAYIFQDIANKSYIIALTHGVITGPTPLYIRLHSSCVTSETLRGCDCDCVQQLEGAFKVIAAKGRGILFYLMQEGRGVGYVAKARDRMLVQASEDRVSTFQAYRVMGLQKDYRHYENISHICHLLGITAPFVVLTNNPDKVAALRAQGLTVAATEALEFAPSPFNLAYLSSKADAGHILVHPERSTLRQALPPEPVVPFKPHALAHAQRFIYSAAYFLPVKPVDNDVLLTEAQFHELFKGNVLEEHMSGPKPLVLGYQFIRDHRVLVKINPDTLIAYRTDHPDDPIADLLTTPYWFKVHVYYDVVTSQEFVVLTHGQPRSSDIPVVRLQSESLFNRFPLRSVDNRDKFKAAVKHIVTYGVGCILLLYYDGRGAGFGAYATDLMLTERGLAGSSDDAYRQIGVGYDSRDYDASMLLLRHHIPGGRIQMVMNSPESLVKKKEYAEALNAHKIDVEKWIFLDESSLAG